MKTIHKNTKKFRMRFYSKKSVFLPPKNRTGCGAVGSALRSGRRGRKFESSHPDKCTENTVSTVFFSFNLFPVAFCLFPIAYYA